jgi:signal transduction histidine kinase
MRRQSGSLFLPSFMAAPADVPYSFPAGMLPTLLAVSLAGIHVLRPLYGETGSEIIDFHLDYLNPAAQRLTGLPEQPRATLLACFPALRANGVLAFYARTFATGEPATFAFNYQADGFDNYFRLAAQRCGEVLVVSFTDTHDEPRTAVEEALRESQAAEQQARAEAEQQRQRFREVLMQLPAYIAVYYGPDHIYQFVNPPYQSRFPHRSFLGRPFREGMPESVGLGVTALFDQVYQTGEPYYLPELEGWFDFDGTGRPEQIFVNLVLHPLRDTEGRIDGVLDFSYDITEQVRARRQVEQLNKELETRVAERTRQLTTSNAALTASNDRLTRTNADLDTFVYTAAHDLRAPVTNLEGMMAVLRESLPAAVQQEEAVHHVLALLDKTVDSFRATITDLTDIARLQRAYDEPAELRPLAPVVASVLADLAPLTTAAGARVQVALPDGLGVSFPPSSLRSIVYNLLSNAVKYHDPARPAQVWVRAEQLPGAVALSVQDNGLGLNAQQQQRLFQAFERLHTHVEGTGVGLYMIKRLLDNAGASIAVASEPGVGSTFTVTFPA